MSFAPMKIYTIAPINLPILGNVTMRKGVNNSLMELRIGDGNRYFPYGSGKINESLFQTFITSWNYIHCT